MATGMTVISRLHVPYVQVDGVLLQVVRQSNLNTFRTLAVAGKVQVEVGRPVCTVIARVDPFVVLHGSAARHRAPKVVLRFDKRRRRQPPSWPQISPPEFQPAQWEM
jgi:hypothetical protein